MSAGCGVGHHPPYIGEIFGWLVWVAAFVRLLFYFLTLRRLALGKLGWRGKGRHQKWWRGLCEIGHGVVAERLRQQRVCLRDY